MMQHFLTVEAKVIGQRKSLIPSRQILLPSEMGQTVSLRELISLIVKFEVAAFRERQEERRFFRVLTHQEITEGAASGKIEMGGQDLDQSVDEEAAIITALQAFEDGLYYVFVDEQQAMGLDAEVFIRPGSKLLFLRLVALVGG